MADTLIEFAGRCDLDRAAHLLREPSSGNEHPIEPRVLDAIYRIQTHFGAQEIRDLQVLSQIAWFDEEFLERDPDVIDLVAKGRGFSLADQKLMGEKQREIVAKVIPAYRRFGASGQIEISTTPFYHPILPLICDSDIGGVSSPGLPLPPRKCSAADTAS